MAKWQQHGYAIKINLTVVRTNHHQGVQAFLTTFRLDPANLQEEYIIVYNMTFRLGSRWRYDYN